MTNKTAHCTAQHINHVAIAVKDIVETIEFYQNTFSTPHPDIEEISDQGVRAALVRVGGSQLEFIEPTDPDGALARFIDRRGEGIHHIAFEVENLQGTLDRLKESGVQLVDSAPRAGLSGDIAFIHPGSTRGILIELVDQDTARR